MKRRNFLFAIVSALALVSTLILSDFNAKAENTVMAIGAKAENFSLPDTNGKTHNFNDLKGTNGVVLIFVSAQCPVVKAYNERMNQITKDYAAKGINVIGINSNATETLEKVKEHAAATYAFPVLLDKGNVIADKFGANVTPEVYYFNAKSELAYRGRIDNDRNGTNITEKNLQDALEEILSGKAITKTETKGFGCSIKRAETETKGMKMK